MRSACYHELANLLDVAKAQIGKHLGSLFFDAAIAVVEKRCVSVPCMQHAFETVEPCIMQELNVRVSCVWHVVRQKDVHAWWQHEQIDRREVFRNVLEEVRLFDVSPEHVEVGVRHDFITHRLDNLRAGDELHCCVDAPAIELWPDADQFHGVVGLVQLGTADVRPVKLRRCCSLAIGH